MDLANGFCDRRRLRSLACLTCRAARPSRRWSAHMDVTGRAWFRSAMKMLGGQVALTIVWLWGAVAASACSCSEISPSEGFNRAQYVFTGEVVEAGTHTWVVEVDRVWKGRETLTRRAPPDGRLREDGLRILLQEGRAPYLLCHPSEGRAGRVLSPAGVQLDQPPPFETRPHARGQFCVAGRSRGKRAWPWRATGGCARFRTPAVKPPPRWGRVSSGAGSRCS